MFGVVYSEILENLKHAINSFSLSTKTFQNLKYFLKESPLPGLMTKKDRVGFEKTMLAAFAVLVADEAYGGKVWWQSNTWFPIQFNHKPNLTPDREHFLYTNRLTGLQHDTSCGLERGHRRRPESKPYQSRKVSRACGCSRNVQRHGR